MKKSISLLSIVLLIVAAGILACEKKKSEGISPTYGTTGNPNPNHQTVTGSATFSNPATQNTSLLVGGAGWVNPTCISTNSIFLKAQSGQTDITLSFASPPTSQVYGIATVAGGTNCAMTIINAPQQPAGLVWVGKSGTVTVATSANAINATFNNVVCTQQTFNFPTVSATGTIGCNQ